MKASGNAWTLPGICAISNPCGNQGVRRGRRGKHMVNPLANDLDHIMKHTEGLWEELRGTRIFITGGTGFFGCWLLESFAWANDKLNLNASALVLSRNPEAFEKMVPDLYKHPAIQFCRGNIQNFEFPKGRFSYLIHGAVYQQAGGAEENLFLMAHEMLHGIKRILEFCVHADVKKTLLVSTGAVYGRLPDNLVRISEDSLVSIDPAAMSGAYHHIRRLMESLGVLYAADHAFDFKIARCFSFIGPYLPLNGRFASSDFIHDALNANPIAVKGDGKPMRSYLYAADLAIWLWTILLRGKPSMPYNVGSEIPTTILELAETIASAAIPTLDVQVAGKPMPGVASDRYIPDTGRAQRELYLRQIIPLAEAIQKTMHWYRGYYSGKEL